MTIGNEGPHDSAGRAAGSPEVLRRRAEELAGATGSEDLEALSPEETRRLVHELRVHQIELEMQNNELRRTQEALEASRQRYFDLYELAPVGYLTLDENGSILEANLRAAILLGLPRSALIQRKLTASIVPEDQDIYYRHLKQLSAASQPQVCEVWMVSHAGVRFWARLEASLAWEGNRGTPASVRATLSDITGRKQAEEERERLYAQLAQARKMESVGRLAGGIAHDFNNLLTVIQGYSSQLLGEAGPGGTVRAAAEAIHAAGESAAALVRQLLAFSRKQVLAPRAVNLNDVIGRTETMLRPLLGENVELRSDLAPDLEQVRVDPHQLEQVIVNLAVNARDAMPRGGKFTLATTEMEMEGNCPTCGEAISPGRYVRLTVRDTGEGMDETTRHHLFEPFFTTKDVGQGTGLGLATVLGIVTQSGGHVQVESEPGKGTTFHVDLPVLPGDPDGGPATDKPEWVLVVDAETDVRRFIAKLLTSRGYQILEASGANEALALCARNRVDLLLADAVMLGIGAVELAARARVLRPALKTLFMSGNRYSGHALPADALCILKPFTLRELTVMVRRALGASGT